MFPGELIGSRTVNGSKHAVIFPDLVGEVPGDNRHLVRFVATNNDKGVLVILRKGLNELPIHLLPVSILTDEKRGVRIHAKRGNGVVTGSDS